MTRGKAAALVIGGGPGGLFAAEMLATAGLEVVVAERMPTFGRKLLMAGRGGLNLTHSEDAADFKARYGASQGHIGHLIDAFPPSRLVDWAEGLGQQTFVGSSGRVFPEAMKASPLLRAWLARLRSKGVTLVAGRRWSGWDAEGRAVFAANARDAADEDVLANFRPTVTVLALGGASWPRLGSDGQWSQVLEGVGVCVVPFAPSNAGVQIAWSPHMLRHAGEPLKRIAVSIDGQKERGEAVVTRSGLEGGAVYAVSAAVRRSLDATGQATLVVDLRPDIGVDALALRLARPRGKQTLSNHVRKAAGLSPAAVALVREALGGALPNEPKDLAGAIKSVTLTVIGLAGLERAISSAGGVSFDAIDDNLMLKARPGVFVAGEMLDWDAPTGGYLLQATFATAHAAALGALRWLAGQGGADSMGGRVAGARKGQ